MQSADKNNVRKLYSSPSANFSSKYRTVPEINFPNKGGFRITDHTDDKYSEISSSQIQRNGQNYGRVSEEETQNAENESRFSKNIRNQGEASFRMLSQKQQNVIQLRQRLKNIHHFYRIRIEQQRTKNIQRNQIFIAIIEQLQKNHNDKVLNLQKQIQQVQGDKQQIGMVDERMGSIQTTIEQILKQSQQLKQSNDALAKQISKKRSKNKDKQEKYMKLKSEIDGLRDNLESFQRWKLKENKRNKELLEMIQHVF